MDQKYYLSKIEQNLNRLQTTTAPKKRKQILDRIVQLSLAYQQYVQ